MNIFSTLLDNLNYATIFFLMLLESTVIPVPSELVVSPAAYHAANGNLDIFLVILFATLGADVGASINYLAGHYLGRPIIYRFANSKFGKLIATITGRLLPGIRHLISIPAGLAKMNYWKFLLYTTIGAGCWHTILAVLGWYLHSIVPESELDNKIMEYGEYIKIIALALVAIAIIYFLVKWYIKRRRTTEIKSLENNKEEK